MYRLILRAAEWETAWREIVPAPEERTAVFELALVHYPGGTDLLARRAPPGVTPPIVGPAIVGLLWAGCPEGRWPVDVDRVLLEKLPMAVLMLGFGTVRGSARGFLRLGGTELRPLDRLRVVGARTWEVSLVAPPASFEPSLRLDSLASRTVGICGAEAHDHLRSARVAIIGAGETGSAAAFVLARYLGPTGSLALIDPAVLEPNPPPDCRRSGYHRPEWKDAGGVGAAIPGAHKVDALAAALRSLPGPPRVEAVSRSVCDWSALGTLLQHDVWVCCVDRPEAQFAAAFLAALYYRPLLDLVIGPGSAIGPAEHAALVDISVTSMSNTSPFLPEALLRGGQRRIGADIRLILPGGPCRLCAGGIGSTGDLAAAREALSARKRGAAARTELPYGVGRTESDSLRIRRAADAGVLLLLDLLAGLPTQSVHLRLDHAYDPLSGWREIPIRSRPECPICARAGRGDAALGDLRPLLAALRFE